MEAMGHKGVEGAMQEGKGDSSATLRLIILILVMGSGQPSLDWIGSAISV